MGYTATKPDKVNMRSKSFGFQEFFFYLIESK